MRMSPRLARLGLPLAGAILFLIAWEIAARTAQAPSVFPGSLRTMRAASELLSTGYSIDLAATALRALGSWCLAILLGVPLGLMLGLSHWAYDLSRGVVAFLRSLPAFMLVLIPLVLGFGGETSRIGIITLASLLIIVDECAESLVTLPPDRIELLKVYGGGYWFIITQVLLYETLGRAVVPAARTTVGISFIVSIVCESLLIPPSGVGARLATSLTVLDMAPVFAFLLLTGTVGLLLNSGIHCLARRAIFWRS